MITKRGDYRTIQGQISFLDHELNKVPYFESLWKTVKSGKTPYEMATLFDQYIEVSSGASRHKRGEYAEKVYNDINNGHYIYN